MPYLHRPARFSLLVVLLSLPLANAASADEVVEQIELGLELYQEEEYGAALTELEFAISDIRKLISERLATTFPDAPTGWSAGEVEAGGGGGAAALMGGGGAMLQRSYSQEDGDGRLEASLMIDNPMVQGMAAMFNNPAMVASQPNLERVRMGRESAIVKWEANRSRVEVTLLLDSRILMQVKGQSVDSPDIAVDMLKAWDLAELRAEAAR